jgi:uncharacterized integral membrane protein
MSIAEKAKNAAGKAAGQVKEAVGQHAGDTGLEAEGNPAPHNETAARPATVAGPGEPPAGSVPAARSAQPPPGLTSTGKVRRTRVSAWWAGLIIAAVILIALLIFIIQNSSRVSVQYLGAHGSVSLAVALLLAAIAGVLLVAIPGTARIVQLRRALKKNAGAPRRKRARS